MNPDEKTLEELRQEALAVGQDQPNEEEKLQDSEGKTDEVKQDEGKDESTEDGETIEFEDPFEKIEKEEEPEGESEEDELADEEKQLVQKEVSKSLDPIVKEREEERRNHKWEKFVGDNAHYQPYKENIRPYVHAFYDALTKDGINGVRVSEVKAMDAIAAMALGSNMLKVGAMLERQARSKANAGSQATNSGSGQQNTSGVPDVSNMSTEEFNKLVNKVTQSSY